MAFRIYFKNTYLNSRNRKEGREGDAMSAVRGEIKRAAARSINVNDPRAAIVYTD